MNRPRAGHVPSFRATRQGGFTFVEVLIALAIVGALLAVAFGGLRVGLAAWRQGEDRAEAHQYVRGLALSLERALAGSYPYQAARDEAPEIQILFFGSEHRLEFVTQAAPFSFPIPIAFTAVVIDLADRESGLVIRQRAMPNRNPFTEATVMLEDPLVTGLEFSFLNNTGSWQNTWDANDEKTLPEAVKVTLTTAAGGQTQSLPPITVTLRVLVP